jgi:hypothetical protein
MNHDIYSLTESHNPGSNRTEVVLQYERETPFQSIRIRKEDWYDLLVDQIEGWSHMSPNEMKGHWRFDALKAAVQRAEDLSK